MIVIKNLHKSYDTIHALRGIDMHIGQGVIFGILGPNGAGKTTLLSILGGLGSYEKGEIEIFGLPLRGNIRTIRKRCAFIPQSLALYEQLTVMENLRFFAGIQSLSKAQRNRNIEYAIAVNHMGDLLQQRAATLSGGQKRRLNIGIGLLNNPDILFFDEPTIGIDPHSRNNILETIHGFKKEGKTVLYSSHYMEEIEKICDEVAIINRGKIIRQGKLQTLLRENDNKTAVIVLQHPLDTVPDQISATCLAAPGASNELIVQQPDSKHMAGILELLEEQNIAIKEIHYQSTTLESLFINLTHGEETDA
jgi:ABC-2 type transport system ATP-binding protein